MGKDNYLCSYCKVKALREEARERGLVVRVRRSKDTLGGVMVYMIPSGTPEDETTDDSSRYFCEWLPSLNDTCVC